MIFYHVVFSHVMVFYYGNFFYLYFFWTLLFFTCNISFCWTSFILVSNDCLPYSISFLDNLILIVDEKKCKEAWSFYPLIRNTALLLNLISIYLQFPQTTIKWLLFSFSSVHCNTIWELRKCTFIYYFFSITIFIT